MATTLEDGLDNFFHLRNSCGATVSLGTGLDTFHTFRFLLELTLEMLYEQSHLQQRCSQPARQTGATSKRRASCL